MDHKHTENQRLRVSAVGTAGVAEAATSSATPRVRNAATSSATPRVRNAAASDICAAASDVGTTTIIADWGTSGADIASAKSVGTVIRTGPGNYLVRIDAYTWYCTLKKKLTLEKRRVTSLICVGDRVIVDRFSAYPSAVAGVEVAGTGVITEILPRLTALTRLSPPDMPGRAPL